MVKSEDIFSLIPVSFTCLLAPMYFLRRTLVCTSWKLKILNSYASSFSRQIFYFFVCAFFAKWQVMSAVNRENHNDTSRTGFIFFIQSWSVVHMESVVCLTLIVRKCIAWCLRSLQLAFVSLSFSNIIFRTIKFE